MKDRSLIILLWILLIHAVLYMFAIPESWMRTLLARESAAVEATVGPDKAQYAIARSTDYFTKFFVDTGLQAETFFIFVPNRAVDPASATAELEQKADSTIFPWVESRLRTVWTSIFLLFNRISVALLWVPLALLTFTPFLIDAFATRKIKSTSFQITSPHMQGIASRAIPLSIVLYVVALLMPVYISPLWVPFLLVLTSALSWVMVAHFVKRG